MSSLRVGARSSGVGADQEPGGSLHAGLLELGEKGGGVGCGVDAGPFLVEVQEVLRVP